MTSVLWAILGFVIAIGLLVSFHEYGHFFVARRLGVKVLRFSIGFGKPLWRRTSKKGTEFVIAAIPLGGYVKMLDEKEGKVEPKDLPHVFNRQPVWARMLIVLAGPFFNFIFAIFAYCLIFSIGSVVITPVLGQVQPSSIAAKAGLSHGDEIIAVNGHKVLDWREVNMALLPKLGETDNVEILYKSLNDSNVKSATLDLGQWKVDKQNPNLLTSLGFSQFLPLLPAVVSQVLPHSPAAKAGLIAKDKITKLAGVPVNSWEAMTTIVDAHVNKTIPMQIERDGKMLDLQLTPELAKAADGTAYARIGIQSEPVHWPKSMQRLIRYPIWIAAWKGVSQTWNMSVLTLQMLYKMIIGKISVKTISGPIGIAQIAGVTAQLGFISYLSFLALISISLGIINILPIPMLDGGHFLYFVIEAIRGKPLSDRSQILGMKIGLLLLVALMIFAVFNDLQRLIN